VADLEAARGANTLLDRAIDAVKAALATGLAESSARRVAEDMALALQGSILARNAPDFVADAFCATRLCERPNLAYGGFDAGIDTDRLIARAMPQR
jgi:putative acyl-CoA dehydrogenase